MSKHNNCIITFGCYIDNQNECSYFEKSSNKLCKHFGVGICTSPEANINRMMLTEIEINKSIEV